MFWGGVRCGGVHTSRTTWSKNKGDIVYHKKTEAYKGDIVYHKKTEASGKMASGKAKHLLQIPFPIATEPKELEYTREEHRIYMKKTRKELNKCRSSYS